MNRFKNIEIYNNDNIGSAKFIDYYTNSLIKFRTNNIKYLRYIKFRLYGIKIRKCNHNG